ncbi:DUF2634 domain-containing protein [Inediibacterium massiliense]|uniref:DUF2634 domain-containing protein n=1 Tax=Inediibacterium massiliense TaxID=1658111 RepID=UPI0006B4A940|nr:DUF2634 domain-containing protein [Inediibacterium massiliense]
MFPQVANLKMKEEKPKDLPRMGKSFLFDFDKGEFVIKDGRLVEVLGVDAIKGWIDKVLRTEKYKYKIYQRKDKNEYGVIVEDLIIGKNLPKDFIEAELKREISQSLMKHPMIASVYHFEIKKVASYINLSFKVNLINEETFNKEVKSYARG